MGRREGKEGRGKGEGTTSSLLMEDTSFNTKKQRLCFPRYQPLGGWQLTL